MAKYMLVVPSDPHPGQDDDYNRWYDEVHLGDLLKIPGVKSGRRFVADPVSPNQGETNYLALYEIETDDPAQFFAEMHKSAQSGAMVISPALNAASAKMMLYKER